jgi:hypothetical protein
MKKAGASGSALNTLLEPTPGIFLKLLILPKEEKEAHSGKASLSSRSYGERCL